MNWPSVSTQILICKLTFLAKLLANSGNIISDHIFSSLAIVDIFSASIVQQCRMLESALGTHILAQCLENPLDASSTVRSCKEYICMKISISFWPPLLSIPLQGSWSLWTRQPHGAACGTLHWNEVSRGLVACSDY